MTLAFEGPEAIQQGSAARTTEGISHEATYLETLFQKESFTAQELGDTSLGLIYFASKEPLSEVPLVIAPGFSAPSAVYYALAAKLADTGKNTAIYRPRRKQKLAATLSPGHMKDVLRLQMQTVHEVMDTVRHETGIEEFDLAGHSMGNVIATGVAYHHMIRKPSTRLAVRNLIADAGAGLDVPEQTTVTSSIRRHAERLPNVARYELRGQVSKMMEVAPSNMKSEALRHISDLGRLAREGFQVMTYPNVIARLERLREDTDIKIGALLPEYDQFFYPTDVKARSGHLLHAYVDIPGAYHVHANTHPDEHSEYMLELLRQLDAPGDVPHAA